MSPASNLPLNSMHPSLSRPRQSLLVPTIWIVAVLAAALLLAALYGLLPGQLPAAGMQQFFLGLAMCYAENLPWAIRCEAVAQPEGYLTMFGLPVVLSVASLHALGIPLVAAGKSVSLLFLAVAAWGCFRLAAGLGMRTWIAALVAVLFLASPIVFAQDLYGPLRLGFALVPLYAWLDWYFAQRLLNARDPQTLWRSFALGLFVLTLSRNFALFCDGYSFVMGLLLSGLLAISVWVIALTRRNWTLAGLLPLMGMIPTVLAYLIYRGYVGAAVEDTVMPIDFFRGQGVDLYALLVPSSMYWLLDWLGLSHSLSGWQTFSDGPNTMLVYLGWMPLLLGCLALAVCLSARRGWQTRPQRLAFASVLAAAMISLLLSLGPSLKIADFRSDPQPRRFIEFNDYLMPADAATLSLGTDWIYQEVPGLRNMRAVYRWNLLFKLCMLLLAGLGIEWLARRRRWLAVLMIVPLIAEALPDVAARSDRGRRSLAQYEHFEQQAASSFAALDLQGKRVLLMSGKSSRDWNDYLANFLCPYAGALCYNAGGDKSLASAQPAWPPTLQEIMRGRYVSGNLRALAQDPAVDVIVMPLFDLRHASYVWPPAPRVRDQFLQQVEQLAERAGLEVESSDWFARLFAPVPAANHSVDFVDGHIVEVLRWGPYDMDAGSTFNVQGDGRSSFWFEIADAEAIEDAVVVLFDGEVLDTFHRDRLLSARFWRVDAERALPPGDYQLSILHRDRGIKQDVGTFHIKASTP